ncbi:MAG: hypothetical protein ACYCWE_20780 [Eubacteriales bacterium]
MSILNFILMHIDSVLLVIAVIAVIIVLYVRGEKKILNYVLFAAVTEAERQYKGGTGILKKAFVIAKIYSVIPAILKIIISEDQIGRWIEDALTYAKEQWKENALIENYIKGSDIEDAEDKPPGDMDTDYFGT